MTMAKKKESMFGTMKKTTVTDLRDRKDRF